MDEREEGEISLEDVSSSEETTYNHNWGKHRVKSGSRIKHEKRVEVDILRQDAAQGKENRQQSNELVGERKPTAVPTLLEKNDDLLPISSEDELEFVGLPGSSQQLAIPLGPGRKKKKKKKKKKSVNPRMLTIDDFVSTIGSAPCVLGLDDVFDDEPVGRAVPLPKIERIERPPSPVYEKVSPPKRSDTWTLSRSPSKRYHTPIKYGRSPIRHDRTPSPRRKSPRQFVSPRKSPIAASDRRLHHKAPRESREVSLSRYDQSRAAELLKRLRRLETLGANTPVKDLKYKESSLKEKLSNIMKGQSESKENIDIRRTEGHHLEDKDMKAELDDEEDLELLRQLALETKQPKNDHANGENEKTTATEPLSKGRVNTSDDDEEDLELRMIALRSAVMKKHQERIQRGVTKQPRGLNTNDESPFSFLDDLDDEENDEEERPVSADALSPVTNSPHLEDMELDSDLEREKDNSEPYSPTDAIAERTIVDTEYPNMSLAETSIDHYPEPQTEENAIINEAQYFDNNRHTEQNAIINKAPYFDNNPHREQNPIINEARSYLENNHRDQNPIMNEVPPYFENNPHGEQNPMMNAALPYYQNDLRREQNPIMNEAAYFANNFHPTAPNPMVNEAPYFDNNLRSEQNPALINGGVYFNPNLYPPKPIANIQAPYSPSEPTNTPRVDRFLRAEPSVSIRDPRLQRKPPGSNVEAHYSPTDTPVHDSRVPVRPRDIPASETPATSDPSQSAQRSLSVRQRLSSELTAQSNLILIPLGKNRTNQTKPSNPIAVPLEKNAVPTTDPTTTQNINAKSSNSIANNDDILRDDILRDLAEFTGEPLYLQGVPDITKDTNKIPTLVNRTLVPRPILKTNKQLQQPLPQKKPDGNNEPAFKSAEMQPVNVNAQPTKTNTVFKPIKLHSVTKKSQVMPSAAAAFNNSFNADASSKLPNEQGSKIVESRSNTEGSLSTTGTNSTETVQSSTKRADEQTKKVRRSRTPKPKTDTTKKTKATDVDKTTNVTDKSKASSSKDSARRQSKSSDDKDGERKSRKSTSSSRKSTGSQSKNDAVAKKSETRRSIGKSVSKSDKKTDDNSKSDTNSNSDNSKQKKDSTSKTSRTKSARSSDALSKKTNDENTTVDKSSRSKVDDKKRRNSIDEDEEELRALLLASLSKRSKTSDPTSATASTEAAQTEKRRSSGAKGKEKVSEKTSTSAATASVTKTMTSLSKQKTVGPGTVQNTATDALTTKKRASAATVQGPPNKIVKKAPAPIETTNILSQAKKLIDAEIQRKLAQNQAAIAGLIAQQASKPPARNNVKINDTTAPISPKMSSSKKLQRLVINLGEDSDSDSEPDEKPLKLPNVNVQSTETKIPTTDFEKSVEAFLRAQREKQESVAAVNKAAAPGAKPSTSTAAKNASAAVTTPLAVRHLPASKQEEYRRLKQRIAEREQQKKQAAEKSSLNSAKTVAPVGPASPVGPMLAPPKTQAQQSAIAATSTKLNTEQLLQDISKAEPADPTANESVQMIAPQSVQSVAQLPGQASTIKADVGSVTNTAMPPLLPDIPIKADPEASVPPSITEDVKPNIVTNEDPLITAPSPMGPMENLRIQIPNIRNDSVPPVRHITINRDDNVPQKEAPSVEQAPPTGPVLRILTTDQLNMKFKEPQIEKEKPDEDKKIPLNDSCKIIENEMPVVQTTTDSSNSSVTIVPVEACKVEPGLSTTERSVTSAQTIVDSEASTLIISIPNQPAVVATKLESDDSTLILNENVATNEQNLPTPIRNESSADEAGAQAQIINQRPKTPDQESPEDTNSAVKAELEEFENLPPDQQKAYLTTMEEKVVEKRYVVLNDLTQMKEGLQLLDMEREIESNIAAEVKRLRIQLKEAEDRLRVQRGKVHTLAPQLAKSYGTINQRRVDVIKYKKLCKGIGQKVVGSNYEVPSKGAQEMIGRLREVASHIRQLKKVPTDDTQNEQQNEQPNETTTVSVSSNNSTIEILNNSTTINPNPETNQLSTPIKTEKIDDDTVINAGMHAAHQNSQAIDSPMNNGTPPESSSTPLAGQAGGNPQNVDLSMPSTSVESWCKVEDEKPPPGSYESVLNAFNTPRHKDPNGVLCPFELMGTCNDEACLYSHLDATRR